MSVDASTCMSRTARRGHNAERSCGTRTVTNIRPTKVKASEINAPRVGSWIASMNPIAIPTNALPNAINGAHDRPANRPTIAASDPTSATHANVWTHRRWSGQSASVAINPIHTPIIDVATAPRNHGLIPRGGGVIPSRFVQASVSLLPHSADSIIVPRSHSSTHDSTTAPRNRDYLIERTKSARAWASKERCVGCTVTQSRLGSKRQVTQ